MATAIGDLTQQRFGKLTVIEFVEKNKYNDKIWKCQCDCGNISNVQQSHLRSGHTTSCGCNKTQLKDLTGKRFGSLTVIQRVENWVSPNTNRTSPKWLCRCDCGEEKKIIGHLLMQGHIKSCGCQNPHRLFDLSGSVFGDMTVLELSEPYINKSGRKIVMYKCICSCGTVKIVSASSLRNGDTTSCGCKINSKGERAVISFLKKHNYSFELHKSFDNCLSERGYKLNFDFYVPEKNVLIECNGIQHYEAIDFFGGEERLKEQIQNDQIKSEFAKANGFSYLEIDCRHKQLKNINTTLNNFFQS